MSGVSRRDYLRAACAASMISPAVRAIEDGRTYTGRGRPLATLTGTLGVNVVSSTPNAPYGQYDVVLAALRDLGVTWIRSRIHTGNKGQVAWINQLAADGIRTNGLIALPGQKDTPEDLVALVAASMPSPPAVTLTVPPPSVTNPNPSPASSSLSAFRPSPPARGVRRGRP